jgi:conjugal transfer ATP-binding protein TraC
MLPGHQSLVEDRDFSMLASRAADMVPVFQAWQGAERPTAILSTRGRELVGFEPFNKELQAWNVTVAGGTGSGKSFTTRTLLCGWAARGGRVVVATRGGDYHRFAQILGGVVCDVSADDPNLALAPFLPREDVAQAESAIEQLASILAIMVQEPGEHQGRRQRRLIHRATRKLYAPGLRGTPDFAAWTDALQAVAKEEPDGPTEASRIISQLSFWLEGPFGKALQRRVPRQDIMGAGGHGASLQVWDLGAIADADTQGVVLALLSGVIARSIKAGPTVVVMDEVWALLRSASGAELVETLYRTVRKEGSSIWSISQSMNDYVGLPDACRSAILNNSPMKVFLAHDASEVGHVSETFKLNEREAHLLASLRLVPGRYSELLLFFGARRQVLCVTPTPTEYWLATSHPRDVEQEQQLQRLRPNASRFELLRELARRYPHGAVDHDALAA